MQYVQDACLVNLFTSSIFLGSKHEPFNFTWEQIEHHVAAFTSEYNFDDAKFLLQLCLMVTSSNFEGKPLDPPSWLHDTQLVYNKCPMELISNMSKKSPVNTPAILGHILYNEIGNLLFIIFTGTSNVCMAAVDLEYDQTELNGLLNYTHGLKAHRGVYSAYQSIRPQLIQALNKYLNLKPKIIISGHSLGAALSQICALDLAFYDPIHYSFAAPMIFNDIGFNVFNNLVKQSYRVANISDLVVLSPLPVMPNKDAFFHVGNLVCFQRNMGEYSLNHAMAYALEYDLV
jgi:hypothetical protein